MPQPDSKISSLIAARIHNYQDELSSIELVSVSTGLRIHFPEDIAKPAESDTSLPSELLGITQKIRQTPIKDRTELACNQELQMRLRAARIGLENISAADTAVGDADFIGELVGCTLPQIFSACKHFHS